MTEEQKKAIDACKDQLAQEAKFKDWAHYREWAISEEAWTGMELMHDNAMELYGEQCRKEAVNHSWVNYLGDDGKTCPCHLCGEQTFGTYDGKPSCLRCAIRLKCQ